VRSTKLLSEKTVLSRIIAKTLDFAEGAGLDRQALTIGAGLGGFDLNHPDGRVPVATQVALWTAIRRSIADWGFGIGLGASLRARELGLLGYAIYFSSTLRGALRRLVRYGEIFNEAVRFRFERPGAHAILVVECPFGPLSEMQYALDARIAGLLAVAREITGVDVVPASVAFEYERPPSTIAHSQFFRCPVSFGAPTSRLSFKPRDLELPIPRGDEQVAGYLSQHAETVLRTLTKSGNVTHSVRSAIWAQLSEGRPTIQAVAAALRLSARTLQRQLADERTSFSAELDHVRSQMAIAALRDRSMPIDEVAFLLGYAEPSSFYRAFHRWTGRTPHKYRRSTAPNASGPTRSRRGRVRE
jgi:AraC-like DNA-binding protein